MRTRPWERATSPMGDFRKCDPVAVRGRDGHRAHDEAGPV
jgi:hypothetical protein